MTGHLKKDFIIMKNDMLVLAGFWVFYALLIIISGGSSEDGVFAKIIYMLLVIFPMVVTMQLSEKPILLDEDSGWLGYALSLPGASTMYIHSKYAFGVLIQLSGMVLSQLYIVLIRAFTEVELSLYIPVVILCITLILMNLEMPFYFRFGYRTGGAVKGVLLLIIVMGIFLYALFGDIDYFKHLDYEKMIKAVMDIGQHKEKWMAVLAAGVVGIGFLSDFVSKRIAKL